MLMERSEPSLVPEWLKGIGSSPGGGISKHQTASSHLANTLLLLDEAFYADAPLLALPKRGRPSNGDNSNDARHSSFQDRSFSTNNRRNSSSNGSTRHDKSYSRPYTNFNRNHRDMEKESSTVSDHWNPDYPGALRSVISGKLEKGTLRRSQSMVPRIQGEPRKTSTHVRTGSLNSSGNANGLSFGVKAVVPRVSFEKDFPSLGSEEKPGTPEPTRVPSPGLSKAGQSLPIVYSAINNGDSWSSALADFPTRVINSSTGSSPAQQPTVSTSESATANATGGLNMAEALTQAPVRSLSLQCPLQNQRFDELAMIQSKRLIPLTPSVPKSLVHNHSDKLKVRTTPRSNDPSIMMRSGNIRAEGQMTPLTGKIRVLKSGQESGVSSASKDVVSPKANVNNRHVAAPSTSTPSVTPLLSKNPVNSKLAGERKAQAQSRTDFFNSVRKKSLNSTSVTADQKTAPSSEDHKDLATETASQGTNSVMVDCNGDASTATGGFVFVSDEEKELEFLRSMGWEPHSGVDEGLTVEEIKEFFEKLMEMMPTSKRCQVVQEMLAHELQGTWTTFEYERDGMDHGSIRTSSYCFCQYGNKFVVPCFWHPSLVKMKNERAFADRNADDLDWTSLEAGATFWNPLYHVFHFGEQELCPLLEEFEAILDRKSKKWLIIPSCEDVMVHRMTGLDPNKAVDALFDENEPLLDGGFVGGIIAAETYRERLMMLEKPLVPYVRYYFGHLTNRAVRQNLNENHVEIISFMNTHIAYGFKWNVPHLGRREHLVSSRHYAEVDICALFQKEEYFPGLVMRQYGFHQVLSSSDPPYKDRNILNLAEINLVAEGWSTGIRLSNKRLNHDDIFHFSSYKKWARSRRIEDHFLLSRE
ncbi:hypothetical protein AKJ16_DCAP23088 [Drosera capensis]